MPEVSTLTLIVNGEQRTLNAPRTLTEFLTDLDFAETELADGDRLEIVRFVQGG